MTSRSSDQRIIRIILPLVLGFLLVATPAFARGGNVLPPNAKPKGYSLVEAAAATAIFNAESRTPEALPTDFPFQILYTEDDPESNTFVVRPGTMLYVPVVFSIFDVLDLNDPQVVSNLYFNPEQYGAEYIKVVVDGEVTSLGRAYPVGVEVPGLVGSPYSTVAVFLTPLPKGEHTVTIQARFTGDLLGGQAFETDITYTVIVQ